MSEWINVTIEVPQADEQTLDILSGELYAAGAEGIEIRDLTEPKSVVGVFSADLGEGEIEARVTEVLESVGLTDASCLLARADPVDWAEVWKQNFDVMRFGRLSVVPTWLEPPDDAELILRLDPGRAFGTGTHETTALCLEGLLSQGEVDSVLDVGTGSGILALSAILTGAKRVVGTDNDPEALEVARENAELNGLSDRLALSDAPPDAHGQFGVVLANILHEPLIALAPAISKAVRPGGKLLLSGLLIAQVPSVIEAYLAEGLGDPSVVERGEWALITLSRSAATDG